MWFSAEIENESESYFVMGNSQCTIDDFLRVLIDYLKDCPDDEHTPTRLEVFGFEDVAWLSCWMYGGEPVAGETWKTLHDKGFKGNVIYTADLEWEWVF
jgi:hypothetical protein